MLSSVEEDMKYNSEQLISHYHEVFDPLDKLSLTFQRIIEIKFLMKHSSKFIDHNSDFYDFLKTKLKETCQIILGTDEVME